MSSEDTEGCCTRFTLLYRRIRGIDHRWRRRACWLAGILFVFFVFPGLLGAAAGAQSETIAGNSQIDGLTWMNVRDSAGVPLASYQFVTDHGSVLHPINTMLWTILGLEFTGYMVIVVTAIWLIGYALSFQWLNLFAGALRGLAHTLTTQIATPAMLLAAAGVGALIVAWFLLRGFHAKATMQVVMMLVVAILGPMFLSEPLGDVLSSEGLLAQGRNVGISVAAGLTGDANPNANKLISGLQGRLADYFVRSPLQVWNFGHLIDDRPACRAVWSAGIKADDDDRIKDGLRACGDAAAATRADNPGMGQIGTGLILLICGTLLMMFAVVLAIRIIRAALDSIYHGFLTIFGFAAGGFIYGPTQNNLIRSLVHSVIGAARMTAYTIFLGVYMLFMANIFQQSRGQVMATLVIACIIEIVAISQLKNLTNNLTAGNDWIANRFAVAVQNGMGRAAGGGGGGSALGMGTSRAGAGAGKGMVGQLSALNTLNSSPAMAWLAAGTMGPFNPQARRRKKTELANMQNAQLNLENNKWNQIARSNHVAKALTRAPGDGPKTELDVANMLDGLGDNKTPEALLVPAMVLAGATHKQASTALRVAAVQKASMSGNTGGVPAVQKAIAATYAIANHNGDGDPKAAIAAQAVVATDNFQRHAMAPVTPQNVDHDFVRRVRRVWDSDVESAKITPAEWRRAGRDTRWHIGNQLAMDHKQLTHDYYDALTGVAPAGGASADILRDRVLASARRLANLHSEDPSIGLDPWHH